VSEVVGGKTDKQASQFLFPGHHVWSPK